MSTDTLPRFNAQHVRDRLDAWMAEHRLPTPALVTVTESKSAALQGADYIVAVEVVTLADLAAWAKVFNTDVLVTGSVARGQFRAWAEVICPTRLPGVPAYMLDLRWFPEIVA